jgi:hypothetical protein
MSFDLEVFKNKLQPFGHLTYAIIIDKGKETEHLEFAVDSVNYLYCVSNFGTLVTTEILPFYPNLIVLSLDNIRLKGAFKK